MAIFETICFQGSDNGKFNYPWGICTDSLGFIYVCDKENHRIQVFVLLRHLSSFDHTLGIVLDKDSTLTRTSIWPWVTFSLCRFSKATALLSPSLARWAASPASLSIRIILPSATQTVSSSPTQTTTDFRYNLEFKFGSIN